MGKKEIRTCTTLEFLGAWEQMYNPDFKVVEFGHFKMQAGLPSFVLTSGQWLEKTNAKADGNVRDYATLEQLVGCLRKSG
jgi:hypothetical protein